MDTRNFGGITIALSAFREETGYLAEGIRLKWQCGNDQDPKEKIANDQNQFWEQERKRLYLLGKKGADKYETGSNQLITGLRVEPLVHDDFSTTASGRRGRRRTVTRVTAPEPERGTARL
ncbi:hypothetical protein EVAR_43172_1 [Eumeta japonica]|uniref:Uncharacterized protein n=1 Tax=Eumeta variegata TaxID=151549 RepID=A0A4C1XQB9_EUMVA|nr:hypothetical protein EVAR_43172_1 [Eumeta japonica]